jgi:TolA-binding protein
MSFSSSRTSTPFVPSPRHVSVLILALAALPLLSSCVTMGKYHALNDRVHALEKRAVQGEEKASTLETRLDHFKGLKDKEADELRTRLADLSADYSELQMTLGMLQGRQEEIQFKLNRIGQHLTGLKGLVEDRFGVDSEALPRNLPEEAEALFALGKEATDQGLTRKARAIFKHFLAKHPQHEKADDAQFMVGETLFIEERFTEAVNAFKTVYDQYQTGDRYQDAVLRIGLCYVRSNKCQKALKIYKFAKRTFPKTPTADEAEKEIKKLQGVCK